jgi:hypothetical protein
VALDRLAAEQVPSGGGVRDPRTKSAARDGICPISASFRLHEKMALGPVLSRQSVILRRMESHHDPHYTPFAKSGPSKMREPGDQCLSKNVTKTIAIGKHSSLFLMINAASVDIDAQVARTKKASRTGWLGRRN